MNVCIFLLILITMIEASHFFSSETAGSKYLVVGPKYMAKREEVPYQVLIVYNVYYCSGSLITSRIVITAASCFLRRQNEKIVVKIGSKSITDQGEIIPVLGIKLHEYFQYPSIRNNDIALLVLQRHVKYNVMVKKVLIVKPDVALTNGVTFGVAGWGHTNLLPKYLNSLLWTEMSVMDNNDCKRYTDLLTSSNFCAEYQVDRLLSDNGGGAVYNKWLVGILSFGGSSLEGPHIAMFTNVSYFNRWIKLNSKRLLKIHCKNAAKMVILNLNNKN